MKKKLLLSALLLSGATCAQAQLTVHSFENTTWQDSWGESYYAMGNFFHVSANGFYAVGYDDQEQSSSTGGAFLWRRDIPDDIEFINTTDNRVSACDVTNNGVIVGSFEERDEDGDATVCYPGWRTTDGVWHQLPVPEKYSTSYATDNSWGEQARAVTPDGKYIGGYVDLVVGQKEIPAQGWLLDVIYTTPVLWEKNGDSYDLKATYTDLGAAGKSYMYRDGEMVCVDTAMAYELFYVWDISNDGRTLSGFNQASSGGFNPAFIRDGVLYQLFDCDILGEDGIPVNFNGGICNSIDANGNIYGYYQDGEGNLKSFVYTTDGKLEYFENRFVTCAAKDGTTFESSSNGVAYVLDCSEDGTVVAGNGEGYWDMGPYSYPMLASDDTVDVTSIDDIRQNVSVDLCKGGMLYISGEYSKATVFNAQGQQVAQGAQGTALNIASQPAGSYIVSVSTPQGSRSFKIVK